MDYLSGKKRQVPRAKKWIKQFLELVFRVDISGHYQPVSKSLIIANRTSVIDVLLLAVFLPIKVTIALPPGVFNALWMKILSLFADVTVIDTTKTLATRALIKAIKPGKPCVIFPAEFADLQERSLKAYESLGLVLQKIGGEVTPIHIERTPHLFPKMTLRLLPPVSFLQFEQELDRKEIAMRLFRLISDLTFLTCFKPQTLFIALLQGVSLGIKNRAKIEDSNRTPLTYRQFLTRCFILGRQIKNQTIPGEHVGVMMPTSTAGMVTFFALQAYRRIPAMLNFSMGFYHLIAACTMGGINTIYTSRQFITLAKLEVLIDELQVAGIKIYFLEDMKSSIHLGHKFSALLKGMFPKLSYQFLGEQVSPEQTALILFTSGSEGYPKGVALSHSNLLANCYQMISRVDFTAKDVFFNSLPIFHTFGLTAGSIIPLITGITCFFYPSPLHYKIIPGLVYQTGTTIMFGTDTFLTGYARAAEKQDFSRVRYIFAGAEKVKPETLIYWCETFGVTIYEGYGATEASPVISLNCPLASIPGTVGMIVPGMESRIEPVEGIAEGGRLWLRGPNIMRGYLNRDRPGFIHVPEDGWYDTGDIVTMSRYGFITIIGRAKRFAKIAGEMISLTAVEGIAASVWPELLNAAVVQKCSGKGERILLFSEASHADKGAFIRKIQEQGYSELLIPHRIFPGSKIPVLSSGKIDYVMLDQILITQTKTITEL
ncbi:AMP-binding protein [Legionella maioricensis]|uniref:AMP-binding protein n=1 Tax=Legionella maioricensis TaxID=2896528 RepID=A0A9X2IE38_9GAMM|nr:AMP-binding protein [Legionella maioricensis]MCL9685433.1 AMP-binding protein [Legionella maioricensis]MCL9688735.1 AMP-binding protein [Legionella maioricensis]